MGKGEWLTILGIVAAMVTTGLAGWVNNESRISTLESKARDFDRGHDVLVTEILELTKMMHELKGMHLEHVEGPAKPVKQ